MQALVNAEYHEVVLAGANLASYGRDLPGNTRLDSLIRAILADTDLPRLRLSSL